MPTTLIFNLNKAPATNLLKHLIKQSFKESHDVILLDTFAHPRIWVNDKKYERKKLDEDFSKQACRELGSKLHEWRDQVAIDVTAQQKNHDAFLSVWQSLANDSLSRINHYYAFSLYMLEGIINKKKPAKIILVAGLPEHHLCRVVKGY